MTPELRQRIDAMNEGHRAQLAAALETLAQKRLAHQLDEADMHDLIDEIVKPTSIEIWNAMTAGERQLLTPLLLKAKRAGGVSNGMIRLEDEEAATAVPWLANQGEVERRVAALRAQPVECDYDPDARHRNHSCAPHTTWPVPQQVARATDDPAANPQALVDQLRNRQPHSSPASLLPGRVRVVRPANGHQHCDQAPDYQLSLATRPETLGNGTNRRFPRWGAPCRDRRRLALVSICGLPRAGAQKDSVQ